MIDVTNNKQQEESADVLEFKSMIEEVNTWLRNTILKSLNFGEHNQSGQEMAYCAKQKLY